MVQSKNELFDKGLNESAKMFKALGHPARLSILKFLAESKTCITGDISEVLPLGRTTVNQHLAELKKVGLIQGQIKGVKTMYCIDPEILMQMKGMMIDFLNEIETKTGCC